MIALITINELYNDVMGEDAELNRLLPAFKHITENYAGRITIGKLAKRCSYSESQFTRLFRRHMRMTAYAFVEQVRIHHALEALRHSATSIIQIALDSGFYDHSAFVKRFKKFTGTTPPAPSGGGCAPRWSPAARFPTVSLRRAALVWRNKRELATSDKARLANRHEGARLKTMRHTDYHHAKSGLKLPRAAAIRLQAC